jgi:hypothetical protein
MLISELVARVLDIAAQLDIPQSVGARILARGRHSRPDAR